MSDTSQGPGWWLATDNKWYPPELHPDANKLPPPPAPLGFQPLKKSIAQWTQGVLWAAAASQVVLAFIAFRYWSALNSWINGSGSLDDAVSAENNYSTMTNLSGIIWFTGFVFLVVWSAQVHTSTTSLLPGARTRKYTRAWSIGVWFIPIANIFSTPQVIAENQRIAYAPRNNSRVSESWRSTPIQPELIWWWVLVIGGFLVSQVGRSMALDELSSTDDYLSGVTAIIIGSGITAFGIGLGARVIMDMNARLTK